MRAAWLWTADTLVAIAALIVGVIYPAASMFRERETGIVEQALGHKILDVPQARVEAKIEPDLVPDDRRQKMMAGIRDPRHLPTQPHAQRSNHTFP